MANLGVRSISSHQSNVRRDIFPLGPWTITTNKGIILQSQCTCQVIQKTETNGDTKLCNICDYNNALPNLKSMPDMLFNENSLRAEHSSGLIIEFNALGALKLVEETQDPLRVAIADGWQSARSDFKFAKSIVRPYDWTFTTSYRGSLCDPHKEQADMSKLADPNQSTQEMRDSQSVMHQEEVGESEDERKLEWKIEETDERIDINKLKVREEILFYDDITLYEDELADHGTAKYSIKIRVMPKSFFILARFYLRVDGVLVRINDTRIYHELDKDYLLREYTNREAKVKSLDLPLSVLVDPNLLQSHLPLVKSTYEKLKLPGKG